MKNLKKLFAVIAMVFGLSGLNTLASDGGLLRKAPINITVVPFYGPTTNELGYKVFTETVLPNILSDEWHDGWTRVGYRLNPDYIIAPNSGSGKRTLWFSVLAWSDEPFDPSDLVIEVASSDSGNSLGKIEVFGSQYDYHPNSAIGRRENGDKITEGKWNSAQVTQFAFIGTACSTYKGDTLADQEYARGWLGRQGNFAITVTAKIRYGGQTYQGQYKIELHPKPEPPRIIRNGSDMKVYVGGLQWDQWLVQTRTSQSGPWVTYKVVQGGDYVNVSSFTTEPSRFFRVAGP